MEIRDATGLGGIDLQSVGGTGLLDGMRRHRWLVLLVAVNGMMLGALIGLLRPTIYVATAELILQDPRRVDLFGTAAGGATVRSGANQVELITSDETLGRAAAELGSALTVAQIRSALTVSVASATDRVRIAASRPDAAEAADLANAVADAYRTQVRADAQTRADQLVGAIRAQQVEARLVVDATTAQLEALAADGLTDTPEAVLARADRDAALGTLDQLETVEAQVRTDAAVMDPVASFDAAEPPSTPREGPTRDVALTTALGLVLGALAAWWLAERRPVAQRRSDVARAIPAPVLGEIGPGWRYEHRRRETVRRTVGSLEFLRAQDGSGVFLVVATPGCDVAGPVLALAATAVAEGHRVVVVDADLESGALSSAAGVQAGSSPGLLDLLDQRRPVTADDLLPVGTTGARLLPAGTAALHDLPLVAAAAAVRAAVQDLADEGGLVLVAAPPLEANGDAATLLHATDGVVVVVGVGTPLDQVESLRALAAAAGASLVGTILDHARPPLRTRLARWWSAVPRPGFAEGPA